MCACSRNFEDGGKDRSSFRRSLNSAAFFSAMRPILSRESLDSEPEGSLYICGAGGGVFLKIAAPSRPPSVEKIDQMTSVKPKTITRTANRPRKPAAVLGSDMFSRNCLTAGG